MSNYVKCEAILNSNGKQCGRLVYNIDQYCKSHEYFSIYTDGQKLNIKNNKNTKICNNCKKWHFDINPKTNTAYVVCNPCKTENKINKQESKKINQNIQCNWASDIKTKRFEKYTHIFNADGNHTRIENTRIIGINNFLRCENKKQDDKLYCLDHEYASSYTDDDKNNVSNCYYCSKIILLVLNKNCCKECDLDIKEKNNKKPKIDPELKCIVIINENQCKFLKFENNNYCKIHLFTPERNEININIGNMMCNINNVSIDDIDISHKISCSNCNIQFVYGTSITTMGNISDKCPYCIIYLRDYDSKRDRPDRDYKLYEKTPERIEAKKIYKENNYAKFVSYWIKYRGNKILKLGVDEYRKQNNEYAKKSRELYPEKQIIINNLKKVNMKYKYGYYKRSALDKGRIFELLYEDCERYFLDDCFYCNSKAIKDVILNGIDRINNNDGYTINNCVSACTQCNMMKGSRFNHITFVLTSIHIMTNLGVIDGFYSPLIFKDFNGILYDEYNNSATRRNYNFELSVEEFYKIKSNKCYLCGKQNSETHSNGIDRIDNFIGYEYDNCKPCCGTCNYLKLNYELYSILTTLLNICKNYCINLKIIKNIDDILVNTLNYNNVQKNKNQNYFNNNNDDEYDGDYLNELCLLLPNNISDDFYGDKSNMDNYIDIITCSLDNNINTKQNIDEFIEINCVLNDMVDKQYIIKFCEIADIYMQSDNNISITQMKKLAINKRIEQKIIDKPINDVKLISNNCNPENIQYRIQQLVIKKTKQNDVNNNDPDINKHEQNIEINYNLIINKHKHNIRKRIYKCDMLYKTYIKDIITD